MYLLLTILYALHIKVVLPCPGWVFPEDADECCAQKILGGILYTFLKYDETAVNEEFQCSSNCTYQKEDEPDSRYCFREGGSLVSHCRDSIECTNNTATALLSQWNTTIFDVSRDLNRTIVYGEKPHKLMSFDQFLAVSFTYFYDVLSPEQKQIFEDAKPCSAVRIECDKCYKTLLESLIDCYKYYNPDHCKSVVQVANAACKPCFCEISRKCNPELECLSQKKFVADADETEHPCERDCTKSHPLKCVYNLTLERLNSDVVGRMMDGRNRSVLAYNQQIPGPRIVICEGDDLLIHFTNGLIGSADYINDTTTLHLHGFRENLRPYDDGVPFVNQCPIPPGKSHKYGFDSTSYSFYNKAPPGAYTQAGTYWYHSHVGAQRTDGAYGALIVRPNKTSDYVDNDNKTIDYEDNAENTLLLQEWYESPENKTIRSLLINGNGRIDTDSKTSYAEFIVKPGKRYIFRIIGAISENIPMRLSIDNHKFTAIATDSQTIEPVEDLTYLWIAAGERFDIVVQTKKSEDIEQQTEAYKIRVIGISEGKEYYCTIAWLKYQTDTFSQSIVASFVAESECPGVNLTSSSRTLNPVPNNFAEWEARLKYDDWKTKSKNGNIYIGDLRAKNMKPNLVLFARQDNDNGTGLKNTQYVELADVSFNNKKMKYPNVPFVLQDGKEYEDERCGTVCLANVTIPKNLAQAERERYVSVNCSTKISEKCHCQHVLQQPFAPGYWVDIILINNYKDGVAHPIHLHGGWFWVMGMAQYNESITLKQIKDKNEKCSTGDHCLWTESFQGYNLPPAKDTIQVPRAGYVILRIPLDNKGTWLMHCHINRHVNAGMAMVLQIGGFGLQKDLGQDWCTGGFEKNTACATPPPNNYGSCPTT